MTKPVKQAVRAPDRGAQNKKKKPARIPKSIQFLTEDPKAKLRLTFAIPGRYILKGRKGTFSIVRLREPTRFNRAMLNKAMQATATAEDFEALSAQPGPRASVDNKMGKKSHPKGVLAAGWWMFYQASGEKAKRAYIGGRISGRRLRQAVHAFLGIQPTVDATKKRGGNQVKIRTDISSLTPSQQRRYRSIVAKGRQIKGEINKIKASVEDKSTRAKQAAARKIKPLEETLAKLHKAIAVYQKKIRLGKEKAVDAEKAKAKPAKQEKAEAPKQVAAKPEQAKNKPATKQEPARPATPEQAKIDQDKARLQQLTDQLGSVRDTKRRSLLQNVIDQLRNRIRINVTKARK